MAIIIRGKNAGLNAAFEGLAQGLPQGFAGGQAARRTKLAEDQLAEAVTRANRQLELDEAQEKRAIERDARDAEQHGLAMERVRSAEAGSKALLGERLDSLPASRFSAGYVAEGGLKDAAKSGLMGPARFAAGLEQRRNAILDRAKKVGERLGTDEQRQAFFGKVQGSLMREEQDATLNKLLSDIDGLEADMTTELGGGAVQDLVGESGDGEKPGSGVRGRTNEVRSLLQAAMQMELPEGEGFEKAYQQRQQILATAAQAIGATHDRLNEEEFRRKRVATLTTEYESQFANERAALANLPAGSPLKFMAERRLQRMEMALIAFKRNRDWTEKDLFDEFERATKETFPSGAFTGGRGGASEKPLISPENRISARKQAMAELQSENEVAESPVPITNDAIDARTRMILGLPSAAEEAEQKRLSDLEGEFVQGRREQDSVPFDQGMEQAVEQTMFKPPGGGTDEVSALLIQGREREAAELLMKLRGKKPAGEPSSTPRVRRKNDTKTRSSSYLPR